MKFRCAPSFIAFGKVTSMSIILANASRLKPEIRLAQAVSQPEADISNEQKTTVHTYRSRALDSSPDPSNVMQLTAEIDRRASGKVGGRCFGPRFTNFLQVVQQFAALGDVVVGGSQNIIACGVWSLIHMSVLSQSRGQNGVPTPSVWGPVRLLYDGIHPLSRTGRKHREHVGTTARSKDREQRQGAEAGSRSREQRQGLHIGE
ncbi:hypothetical protein K469DRAFT_755313 [Zopfia rhizophila CBS 207.26]|uniref:Uncharacterized protein n=1 Tax=Zopfia rhizophila CBS 207.26 TaxID=1314779 RepID=A0A6A6DDI4_9PEZI|nr:hypothetical protein K469DRAFT_755313 [Zopfia rhizophila CBS 207.26]